MDLDEFEKEHRHRVAKAMAMGGKERLEKRRTAGVLNARERIDLLFDDGSFRETGLHTTSANPADRDRTPADGKITGFGKIGARRAAAVANDLTVMGASSSATNARKIAWLKDAAGRAGVPLVFLGESSGARIGDTMGARSMGLGGQDPQQYCRRREIPWASAVLGPCFGSSTWYTCISDFVVMRKGALLAVSSPKVTSVAINEEVDPEELGGWRLHSQITGLVDRVVDTDAEAIAAIRGFLSYLPSHSGEAPPVAEAFEADDPDGVVDVVPLDRRRTYDMRKLVGKIVDRGSFFPIKDRFGKSAVTGLARIAGQSVGIVGANPMIKGGALDPDGCDKVTGFLVLCDSFNIPVILLVDTPGFLVGVDGERKAAPARIMNMMHALQLCSVPKLSVIVRKSYGQAYLNFGGGRNSDEVAAWYTADVSFMDPSVAVSVLGGVDPKADPEAFAAKLEEYARDTSAYELASVFGVQAVIDPRETRGWLIDALDNHRRAPGGGVGRHEMSAWPTYP
jgi:acetyl-CoA carboxylase carboxyltransferase component